MSLKERFQNPTVGDCVKLRLFVYNSNCRADVISVEKVEIFTLDCHDKDCCDNKYRLVETIETFDVVQEETGQYSVTVKLEQEKYVIGKYVDVWTLKVQENKPTSTIENRFQVYPSLWYATPIPVVYDFSYAFRPNKIKKGSKRYIIIDITPNVPTATDLARYYENLAIVSPLTISIEQACTACMPQEQDLRLLVENEAVPFRERGKGYYFLDTTEMETGIYNVWFQMKFGESVYISDKQQLQIYC